MMSKISFFVVIDSENSEYSESRLPAGRQGISDFRRAGDSDSLIFRLSDFLVL